MAQCPVLPKMSLPTPRLPVSDLSPPRCLRHEVGWGGIEAVGRALTASATNNKEASVTEEPTYTRIKV